MNDLRRGGYNGSMVNRIALLAQTALVTCLIVAPWALTLAGLVS